MNTKSFFTGYGWRTGIVLVLFLVVFFRITQGWNMAALAQTSEPVVILAFGDSLTAGYGLDPAHSYPSLLQERLTRDGFQVAVVNAGISGDTSAGGLARLEWTLSGIDPGPHLAIVELGANDGLRGDDPANMEANLDAILSILKERGVTVLFTGMKAMANLGDEYTVEYDAVFPRLAEKHGVAFFPFFLQDVAGVPELNQWDGLHPNEKGTERVTGNIYPLVKELLQSMRP